MAMTAEAASWRRRSGARQRAGAAGLSGGPERGPAGSGRLCRGAVAALSRAGSLIQLIQFKDPRVQHKPLVERGAQRPVQAIFQVELPPPADDMGEEVAVERRILSQHLLQVEHVLGGDELVEPHRAGRYLGPLPGTPRMIGIGPSLSDLLEDHIAKFRSVRQGPLGNNFVPGPRPPASWRASGWMPVRDLPDRPSSPAMLPASDGALSRRRGTRASGKRQHLVATLLRSAIV